MKKLILLAILTIGMTAAALAQGTVVFEDTGPGYVEVPIGTTYQVALLWANGTSVVPQGSLTQAVVYTVNGTQYFYDGTTVSIPGISPAGSVAIFEVQGWIGNYANYAAAVAAGAPVGQTAEFVNATGNPNPPAEAPIETSGWNGYLIITPEPSTIPLCSLGAITLLLFSRRKKPAS